MKNLFYVFLCTLLLCFNSCKDDDNDYKTYNVPVRLVYPAEGEFSPKEGVTVKLVSSTSVVSEAQTDANGVANFTLTEGIYEASVTEERVTGPTAITLNAVKSNISITSAWTGASPIELELTASISGQIVIKELYIGGCQTNDGSGSFARDQYVILYNNSNGVLDLSDVCLGMVLPYTSNGTNKDYVNGSLSYASEGWIPAGTGVWYFTDHASLDPGKQITIALTNALDNTATYSNSINFNKSEYYCLYDIASYPNTTYYPAPVATIPTSHYLKAHHYGTGNAWPLSNTSPAFYIFSVKGTTLNNFIADAGNIDLYGGSASQVRKKVPIDWVIDGIEVYSKGATNNTKRLTSTIDAGYTELTNKQGYSSYRNVNKEATEAIEGNKAKLVYNYSLGIESTDPSGIDAEASIKNGARIIYKDTNNSSNDFHQRKTASLRN